MMKEYKFNDTDFRYRYCHFVEKNIIYKIKKNVLKSSFEELMENPEQKALFDQEYQNFLISELMITVMQKDDLSAQKLAKEAGVSPIIIQKIKSGKRTNITLITFNRLPNVLGYQIAVKPLRK